MVTPANEAPPHLRGIIAKIQRAEAHLISLNDEIMAYLESCRDNTQHPIKVNPHQGSIRIYFQPVSEPDLKISVIVGDCVHNLRSALDHIWKRLGQDDGNFPLFGDLEGPNNWNVTGKRRLTGLPVEAQAIIDALQPCHLRDKAPSHPLSVLNKLSGIDKHEAIHLTRPKSVNTCFIFREKGSSRDVCIVRPPVVFHDKTEVIISGVPPDVVKPGMDVNVTGTMFVAFEAEGPWALQPVQEVLRGCMNFVKYAVLSPLARYTRA